MRRLHSSLDLVSAPRQLGRRGIERSESRFQHAEITRATFLQESGRRSPGRMVRKSERSPITVIESFENGGRQQFEVEESRQHKMAKYRHRTFEMFDFVEEAACALSSGSTRHEAESDDPTSWTFQHLVASRSAKMIHVKFKRKDCLDSQHSIKLRSDFSHLADFVVNDSRVLMDFAGLRGFSTECIDELKRFNANLQSKGSRIVLCNLESAVRSSFFPHRIGNDRTSNGVS